MTASDRRALVGDGLFTVEEAAAFSTLAVRTIYALIRERRLLGVRVGRSVRVPKKALIQFLAERVDAQ